MKVLYELENSAKFHRKKMDRWSEDNQKYIGTDRITFSMRDFDDATSEAREEYNRVGEHAMEHGIPITFKYFTPVNSGFKSNKSGTVQLNSWDNVKLTGTLASGKVVTTSIVEWCNPQWVKTVSGSVYKITYDNDELKCDEFSEQQEK